MGDFDDPFKGEGRRKSTQAPLRSPVNDDPFKVEAPKSAEEQEEIYAKMVKSVMEGAMPNKDINYPDFFNYLAKNEKIDVMATLLENDQTLPSMNMDHMNEYAAACCLVAVNNPEKENAMKGNISKMLTQLKYKEATPTNVNPDELWQKAGEQIADDMMSQAKKAAKGQDPQSKWEQVKSYVTKIYNQYIQKEGLDKQVDKKKHAHFEDAKKVGALVRKDLVEHHSNTKPAPQKTKRSNSSEKNPFDI